MPTVSLQWDDDPTVTGYYIDAGTVSGTYSQSTDVGHPTPLGGIVAAGVSVPSFGTWYAVIVGYNASHVRGASSQELSILLLSPPTGLLILGVRSA